MFTIARGLKECVGIRAADLVAIGSGVFEFDPVAVRL
jgi:hypothetical protein